MPIPDDFVIHCQPRSYRPAIPAGVKGAAPQTVILAAHAAIQAAWAASGVQILGGIGAVVLGILAILNLASPLTLIIIAILTIGVLDFLTGSALVGRLVEAMR